MAYQCGGSGYNNAYGQQYGLPGNSAAVCLPGGPPPLEHHHQHHHHQHQSQGMIPPGSGYGSYNNSAAGYYNSGGYGGGQGQGLVGSVIAGVKAYQARRRRVRKQYPTGEYYSCSETDSSSSSDDEGHGRRRRGTKLCYD